MKDKHGRVIDYLRLSITENCNIRCIYCMPSWESQCDKKESKEELSLKEIAELVKIFSRLGIKKIRLTGGEPLLRKDLKEIISTISKVEGITEICLTTNGILLKAKLKELKEAGLNRINISLDTLNPEEYKKITRGGELSTVLEAINEAKKLDIPVKINSVITNIQDTEVVKDLAKITINDKIDVRFIELMPIGYGKDLVGLKGEEIIKKLKEEYELEDLYTFEGTSRYFKISGAKGRIGVINPISDCFCKSCNRIRVTSNLEMKTCLSSEENFSLKELLNLDIEIEEKEKIIHDIIFNKNKENVFNTSKHILKNMNEIGG